MTKRDYSDLIDGPVTAKELGLKLPAFQQRVARGQIPEAAIVRIGSAVVYRRGEIRKYAAKMEAIAKIKRELAHTLPKKPKATRKTK